MQPPPHPHHHQAHLADHRPSVPARVATPRRSRWVGPSVPFPSASGARRLSRMPVKMDAPRRVQLLSVVAAVAVAAVATVAAAIPAGESCACALADATTVGRCVTFVASSLGAAEGRCKGKDCEPSFECVDKSVATHTCQSRAVQTEPTCTDETAVGAGASCACKQQRSTTVSLTPTQAAPAARPAQSKPAATPKCKPAKVAISAVLAAKNQRGKLPDGRIISAQVFSVGGCVPRSDGDTTGTAYSKRQAWTRMSQAPNGPSCTLRDVSGVPTYVGFQAIRIRISGGTMVPSLRLEDVDAMNRKASEAEDGWRETMTALGRSSGRIVKPQLSTSSKGMTRVFTYQMAGSSLKEVGWGKQPDVALEGVSYASWTTIKNSPYERADMARGSAVFTEPIDDLVVVYALAQADKNKGAKTGAYVSALTVGC
eukprot:TRINITY_DN3119_c0_g1_i1.p1 TRINITY_DN3119_c0_g1~~TRINITY_DN3119_c0_g1_i1.p1  ORF type:complete len:427 (-),score=112.80 TRINITY_DN3119_c0_g1_i1:216-1496(-)